MKSLEDLVVRYDGSVRDSKNNLLEKLYGEDSFMSEYIEKHRFTGAELGEEDFRKKYKWDENFLLHNFKYKGEQVMKLTEEYDKLREGQKRMR